MKTLEYNFEQILKFVLVFLLKFYFEQVNAGWVLRADFPNKPWYSFFVSNKQFVY